MDYEKKYKNALEWARQVMNGETGFIRKEVEEVFPELEENEDERIRKEILDCFRAMKQQGCFPSKHKEQYDSWIAWLEKQGEQKIVDGTFVNIDDVREDFVQEVYRVLDADSTNDRANQIIDAFDNLPTVAIEKQGEQKPVELYPVFRIGDIIERKDGQGTHLKITSIPGNFYHYIKMVYSEDDTSFCDIPIKNQDIFQISPDFGQKPIWSKEDENLFRCAIDAVKQESKVRTDGCLDEEIGEMVTNWLKSLKDRVQPKLKQEWSEEDERIYKVILELMDSYSKGTIGGCIISPNTDRYIKWFKSLKERYTWKPNNEQMLAINIAINVLGKGTISGEYLIELQEELKKLKG